MTEYINIYNVPAGPIQIEQTNSSNFNLDLINLNSEQIRKDLEVQLIKYVGKLILQSNLIELNANEVKELLLRLIDDTKPAELMFKCWDGDKDFKDGVINKFLLEECLTKDPETFNKSIITGLINLYLRASFIQVVYNNFLLSSNMGYENYDKSFVGDFLTKRISTLFEYIPDSYIDDFDSILKSNAEYVTGEFKKLLSEHADPNVDRQKNLQKLFIESLPVYDGDLSESKIRQSESDFFVVKKITPDNKALMEIYATLLREGTSVTVGVIASASIPLGNAYFYNTSAFFNALKNIIVQDKDFKLLFEYCFPLHDYVSIYSMYNLFNLGLNSNSWNQIYDIIIYSIEGIKNYDNFTYNNNKMDKRESIKNSNSRKKDNRSNVTRYLSLPWIFDLLF